MWRPAASLFALYATFFVAFFGPAEFGKLMASGDALTESLPAYLGSHALWEPNIFLGYPMFADPNQQMWYPLALLHLIPGSYNAFAVVPFVLAATGMALFVRDLTRSTFAGIASGFVYSLGGFMISHAGHLMVTHPAAWAPYVLWSVERARSGRVATAIVVGSIALGMCGLAGQPQMLVFTVTLAAAYAGASSVHVADRRSYVARIAAIVAIGLAVAATQLLPELQLARESTRTGLAFGAFVLYEIPVDQIAMRLVFPYLAGVTTLPGFPYSGVDLGAFPEQTIATGFAAFTLAFLSAHAYRADRRVAFWALVALVSLVLAVGDATPFAALIHAVPVYDLFRLPGRHAFEWSIAMSVLAGYGVSTILEGRLRPGWFALACGLDVVLGSIGYAQFVRGVSPVAATTASTYAVPLGKVLSPLTNGAVGIPLAAGSTAILLLACATRIPRRAIAGTFAVVAIALDASAFAWPAYWNWSASDPSRLARSAVARELAAHVARTKTRPAWLPGTSALEFGPNLTALWGVPSLGGYTPLVPRRLSELLDLTSAGGFEIPLPDDVALDVAGAGPIATPAVARESVSEASPFARTDLHVFLSSTFADARTDAEFGLPKAIAGTGIAMVSELGDGVTIPGGATVANVDVRYADGALERHAVVAGRDVSEFEYDREDVKPLVRHGRARIFDGSGYAHRYVAEFSLARYEPVASVHIAWTYGGPAGALTIEKLSLVDRRAHAAVAYDALGALYAAPNRWHPVPIDPSIVAFDDRRALPRVWLAEAVPSTEAEAVRAVRTGVLADRRPFHPDREAAVEGAIPVGPPGPNDGARLMEDTATRLAVNVRCARACFLVDRDAADDDWRVTVDGAPVAIEIADVDLRGVPVPAGRHRVVFRFVPRSLYVGASITLTAVVALFVLARTMRMR